MFLCRRRFIRFYALSCDNFFYRRFIPDAAKTRAPINDFLFFKKSKRVPRVICRYRLIISLACRTLLYSYVPPPRQTQVTVDPFPPRRLWLIFFLLISLCNSASVFQPMVRKIFVIDRLSWISSNPLLVRPFRCLFHVTLVMFRRIKIPTFDAL